MTALAQGPKTGHPDAGPRPFRIIGRASRTADGGSALEGCQALVSPALSLSMTWLIVKLAGVCEGGNSTNDCTIWAT
jgi:hypothetical protein